MCLLSLSECVVSDSVVVCVQCALVCSVYVCVCVCVCVYCSYIVTGDSRGHVKFYDRMLKLISHFSDFNMDSISSLSFATKLPSAPKCPPDDCTLTPRPVSIRFTGAGCAGRDVGVCVYTGNLLIVICPKPLAATLPLVKYECCFTLGTRTEIKKRESETDRAREGQTERERERERDEIG